MKHSPTSAFGQFDPIVLEMPANAACVGKIVSFFSDVLRAHLGEEFRQHINGKVAVVMDELATNAVRHGCVLTEKDDGILGTWKDTDKGFVIEHGRGVYQDLPHAIVDTALRERLAVFHVLVMHEGKLKDLQTSTSEPDAPIDVPNPDKRVRFALSVQDDVLRFETENPYNEFLGPFDPHSVPDPTQGDPLEMPTGRGLLIARSFAHKTSCSPNGNKFMSEWNLLRIGQESEHTIHKVDDDSWKGQLPPHSEDIEHNIAEARYEDVDAVLKSIEAKFSEAGSAAYIKIMEEMQQRS